MTELTKSLFRDIVQPVLENIVQRDMLQWVDFAEVHIAVNEALEKAQESSIKSLEKIVVLYNEWYSGTDFDVAEEMYEVAAEALKGQ